MLCQNCGEKEATVHLTKIINGEKTEVYLCEECAEEKGKLSFESDNPFSFQNLLAGILNPQIESFTHSTTKLTCDNCGLTYKEFSENGLFGCSECFEAFGDRLDPLVKRIHGSKNHKGKVPKRKGGKLRIKSEIQDLRKEMEKAVEKENFEKAADLRDEIHELEEKLGGE
ncbi:MAG: UvrB/UvrC motif-containing protein [Bacillota bacterium]